MPHSVAVRGAPKYPQLGNPAGAAGVDRAEVAKVAGRPR